MSLVRVSTKYQITIPEAIRNKLGIKAGQRLSITELHGGILVTPVPDDPIEYLTGIYADQPSMTEELLRDRREEIERSSDR